jgi:thymidylate synthase
MEAAALLHLVARLTGYKPTWLTIMSNDCHIYENQIEMVQEYLERPTYDLPKLEIVDVPVFDQLAARAYKTLSEKSSTVQEDEWIETITNLAVEELDKVEPTAFMLPNYVHGAPLTAAMAV